MTTDQHAAGDEWWRRAPLYLVVLGAMAVSIGGQVATLEDRIGWGWAIVMSLTNDAGAIIALDAAFSRFSDKTIRTWAWFAIVLSGGTGAALNTWNTINGDDKAALKDLPTIYGWLIGIEPILLVLILTHLVGLLTAARRAPRGVASGGIATAGGRTVGDEVADRQRPTTTTSTDRQPDHQPDHQRTTSAPPAEGRPTAGATTSATTGRPPTLSADDRPLVLTAGDTVSGALVITNGGPSSPGSGTAGGTVGRAAAPKLAAKPTPPAAADPPRKPARATARQDWMTDLLVRQVARKLAVAALAGGTYGREKLMAEHNLNDYRARTLLAYIAERDLAREAAS